MRIFKLNLAYLEKKNWFIMSVFFPVIMIYKMGLFLHPVFSLIFIVLSLLQILVALSLLVNKKEKYSVNIKIDVKKKLFVLLTACVFIGINLFAFWVSYKTAQRESIRFDNLHLITQLLFLFTNLIFIISLFTAFALGKLTKRDA